MEIKPGVKTSEFWIAIGVPFAVAIMNAAFGWNLDPAFLAGLFGFNGGMYQISRGLAKK